MWIDSWIKEVGPLTFHIPAQVDLDLDCKLKDMVMEDGSWNLKLFRLWLSNEVIHRIINIPPHSSTSLDKII